MTEKRIVELYNSAVMFMGAPVSVVPLLVQLSKHMDEKNDIMLYAELRADISRTLNVTLARVAQVLKIMENYGIIQQSTEIRTVFHINKFVLPYKDLENSKNATFIGKKTNATNECQIIIG